MSDFQRLRLPADADSAPLTAASIFLDAERVPVLPADLLPQQLTLTAMDTTPPTGDLYLLVGYDGSPPASRALDAAVRLLHGRSGRIDVVYIVHVPSIDMLSAQAVAEMETSFDELARDLQGQAEEQLRGREERWRFERGQGPIADLLLKAAEQVRDDHPGDNVAIVVGSSSQARHRVVGSVAISLARRSRVPVLIVP
jgi:nucleotide-binding universal stress UspA family protein